MGPTHPVHHQIFNTHDLRNIVWSSTKKAPFVIQVENILNTWNLQRYPMMENISYPVIPPWFNLVNIIEHSLVSPTKNQWAKIKICYDFIR